VQYCARNPAQPDAALSFRRAFDAPADLVPRDRWQFGPDGCSVRLPAGFEAGLYEAVYEAEGSPVAGLGLAAIRDFASYLKFGSSGGEQTLRERPAAVDRVIGFGYSQSGRLLREFVRDGFNQDERGRPAFDGLLVASAGAGGGSFNHRFAMPGQAGNSVLSVLRPVDLPPFTDAGLLARARVDGVVPKIFYTFSSTEYWARAGSLTQTTDDGLADLPPDPSSRLYLLAGTPHASGPLRRYAAPAASAFATTSTSPTSAGCSGPCSWRSTTGCGTAPSRRLPAIRRLRGVNWWRARPSPSRGYHRCRLPATCHPSGAWTSAATTARRV
jgi:hypothetical protein